MGLFFLYSQLFSLFQPLLEIPPVPLSDGVSGVRRTLYRVGGASQPAERLSFKRLAASVVDNQSALGILVPLNHANEFKSTPPPDWPAD